MLLRAQVDVAQGTIVTRGRHRLGDQILQRGAHLAHLAVIGLVEFKRKLRLGLLLMGNVLVVVIRRIHTTARAGRVVAFVLFEGGRKTRGTVRSGGKSLKLGSSLDSLD